MMATCSPASVLGGHHKTNKEMLKFKNKKNVNNKTRWKSDRDEYLLVFAGAVVFARLKCRCHSHALGFEVDTLVQSVDSLGEQNKNMMLKNRNEISNYIREITCQKSRWSTAMAVIIAQHIENKFIVNTIDKKLEYLLKHAATQRYNQKTKKRKPLAD
jgi:hypothetical protein